MSSVEHGKLSYLSSVEQHTPIETEIDEAKTPYLITFPYPYMNGRLHLGHLYTFSKADFVAYYKRQCGYNVLEPFAFHCTGMPISASAYKLSEELEGRPVDVSVRGILESVGFEDVKPFTDPLHWIRTFPAYGKDDLQRFHASVDWRRSFITTDINPYYDSFIRYQFSRLKEAGFISFGKRYSIYCTVDNQACLDHDRRRGEGIKPVEVMLLKVPLASRTLLVRCPTPGSVAQIVISRVRKHVVFREGSQEYVIDEWLYENIKYQVDGVEYVGSEMLGENSPVIAAANSAITIKYTDTDIETKVTYDNDRGDDSNEEYNSLHSLNNDKVVLVQSDSYVKMYVPDGHVISRSGSRCVVALLDQWFINYGDSGWKELARECIDNMELSAETRAKLLEAHEWIGRWGCSRSFGLGTRLPWDSAYLIDSLSDSTIYMALYTFKHLLFKDLEGKEEIFPVSKLGDYVWAYILGDDKEGCETIDKISSLSISNGDDCTGMPALTEGEKTILQNCRRAFNYFYPVSLRVSGKDLIGNHLTFYIFNHVALFRKPFWPRRIFTNGYVMLNSAKMSKSDGNFLSVGEALSKFGVSATRMCLALCGDSNEDANFEEQTANALVLKLYSYVKLVEGLGDECADLSDSMRMVDHYLIQSLSANVRAVTAAYEAMAFRDVVKFAFYENTRLIEQYSAMGGANAGLMHLAYKTITQLIYPIVPSLCNYLINFKFKADFSFPLPFTAETDKIQAVGYVKDIISRIATGKRNRGKALVTVSKAYPEWKLRCMHIVNELQSNAELDVKVLKADIISRVTPIILEAKINKGKGVLFAIDYLNNPDSYAKISFDETEVISLFRRYIERVCDVSIEVTQDDAKAEPLRPVLTYE